MKAMLRLTKPFRCSLRCSICHRKRKLTYHGLTVHLCKVCEAWVSGVFCP